LATLADVKYINIGEAKANFSKLLAAVRKGEEVTICRDGKPVARLTAFESKRKMPKLGTGKDKVKFQPGWGSPETDAEIVEMFDVLKEPDRR
jgi:prevent-host-death family protein